MAQARSSNSVTVEPPKLAINLPLPSGLLAVPGVRLGTAAAAIKYEGRDDIGVMCLAPNSSLVGVFTQSRFAAAPVQLCRERLPLVGAQASVLLVNSGNANAATGQRGREDAQTLCAHAADQLGVSDAAVLPFSTGVIGEFLPVEQMRSGVSQALANAQDDGWLEFASAIMTTDTQPKAYSQRCQVAGSETTITGTAKGAGMMRPDMATMLAFIATDAAVSTQCAQTLLKEVCDASFNRITVDGDTSTNDSLVLCCTGASGAGVIESVGSPAYEELKTGLLAVAIPLAQAIVRDGEGATKFVSISVGGASSEEEALEVAYTVAHSPLVKTAIFAGDPNWGRFCMAIGRAGIADLDQEKVSLSVDTVRIAEHGLVVPDYDEAAAAAVMALEEYAVTIDLGRGMAASEIWTSDLSYEYVRVNAEYRS